MKSRKAKPGDPRVAVAYLRVSTEEQNLGPDAQRAAIERWAALQGVSVVAWHQDQGVSGAAPLEKRHGLGTALRAIGEHGAGVLVVAKRDRLARDVMVAAVVEQLVARGGARIVSADGVGAGDGPEAALMRTLIDAFSQYERAMIRMRTRAALRVKKARGERVGEAPFGYRIAADGVRLEAVPEEQSVMEQIRSLRATGASLRAIVGTLSAAGVRCRGSRWHLTTVYRIVSREREAA